MKRVWSYMALNVLTETRYCLEYIIHPSAKYSISQHYLVHHSLTLWRDYERLFFTITLLRPTHAVPMTPPGKLAIRLRELCELLHVSKLRFVQLVF